MVDSGQSFQAHRRYLPPYHFFVLPVLTINVLVQLGRLFQSWTLYQGWMLVVAIALIVLALMARLMALTVQTRVIRLEAQLRLQRLMPGEEHSTIASLKTSHLVALRLARDEEAPKLAHRCAAGDLKSSS